MLYLLSWMKGFIPQKMYFPRKDYLISPIGALVGLAITEGLSKYFLGETNPWFIAPMGASAVLLFAVPASPLAQPWSIIGGNLIASLIGVTCSQLIPSLGLAGAIAVGLTILLAMKARCLHPPSGAVALTAVFGGETIHHLGYLFVIYPTLINSMLLAAMALFYNNLVKRSYPHHAQPTPTQPLVTQWSAIERADIEFALENNKELLDINEEDLELLLNIAERHAQDRDRPKSGT
ncbi:HPP family protein [Ferrovum sp. PN-J185]|uniref:HPP family protein n=1 Tax=Ferrovum sp. PN-J185 TaxID=1356306 RepID=UPI0007952BC7|nr:HPP family protein [Ferrovum sp. PN-J185]KXW55168.1 HPP family protein [Ferrovum sp. PN-J185]MCC6068002.1 HPP family protein [Ferrovum sp. PN-J185]MDE1892433.1 HPP family protein [Betaproteobacteria bacterium]MDE2056790.1 HPP family protein [Betaproteobacteria bacterium]